MQKAKAEVETGIWSSAFVVNCVVIFNVSIFVLCNSGTCSLLPALRTQSQRMLAYRAKKCVPCFEYVTEPMPKATEKWDCCRLVTVSQPSCQTLPWGLGLWRKPRKPLRAEVPPDLLQSQWERLHCPLLGFAQQNMKGGEISSQLTWISTELDALASVRDSFSCVTRVDDVAFIACGAMQRLISILSGTAGFSCKRSPQVINHHCNTHRLPKYDNTDTCPPRQDHFPCKQTTSHANRPEANTSKEAWVEWVIQFTPCRKPDVSVHDQGIRKISETRAGNWQFSDLFFAPCPVMNSSLRCDSLWSTMPGYMQALTTLIWAILQVQSRVRK